MRKLERRVLRETGAHAFERGQERPIVVVLEPPSTLGFRLKGTRRTFRLPASTCYFLAVRAEVEAKRSVERREK